jgi:hypothetical protein
MPAAALVQLAPAGANDEPADCRVRVFLLAVMVQSNGETCDHVGRKLVVDQALLSFSHERLCGLRGNSCSRSGGCGTI